MLTTLRHLKLWKRRGSAGNTDRPVGANGGTNGSTMFRSPSSDSGYSDVQTTLALRCAVQPDAAAVQPSAAPLPSPVELLPPSRSGVDRPAICVTAPPASPTPPPPPPLPSFVDQSRPGVDVALPRGRRSADRLLTVSEHRPTGVCVLRRQEMVSVEAFFDYVKRRDVDSIHYALRDAHYDIDSQDVVSSLSFWQSSFTKTRRALGGAHMYLRQRCSHGSRLAVNKTILKPRVAEATGAQYLYV